MDNKFKNEIIDSLNRTLGLLISLRTVETSPLDTRHWVNCHIDKVSVLRNELFERKYDCSLCNASIAVYDALAEVLSDAQCCPECQGTGFQTRDLKEGLLALLAEAQSKQSSSVVKFLEEFLAHPVFK